MAAQLLFISSLAVAQPNNPNPIDPRRHFDKRCPPAIRYDNASVQRDPTSTSSYLTLQLPVTATVADCAVACCHDWSCESFSFYDPKRAPTPPAPSNVTTLTGDWFNHDSLRGVSKITITEYPSGILRALSLETSKSEWHVAYGIRAGLGGYLSFDNSSQNNRTLTVSADLDTIQLSRESFDPKGFTQNFTRSDVPFAPLGCSNGTLPCCVLKDDVDPLVPGTSGVTSAVRAQLPARPPPYPASDVATATLDPHFEIGINGDEFPITWGKDGNQYTGAGDNRQADGSDSPLSFFKVSGGPTQLNCTNPPTHGNQPSPVCSNITMQGNPVPLHGPQVSKACPEWHKGIPNLKSSGVLSVDGTLYWAVSCFNYGDDDVFNRQRYGPAWIVTSTDGGVTFNLNATPTDMFPGRLSAPRFIQYGQDFSDAPSDWVYVYFPGTTVDSAFFENNDQILLARVNKRSILNRSAYQFFNGLQLDGTDTWTTDSTIAVPVWSFPLMTSVQQANFHPGLNRYIFANWAWISYDGYPRPDHTGDERNGRTGHQRTQLSLVEGENPWGPFKIFYRDDSWQGWDGSSGGYTPVFPPAWIGKDDFWMVFTQCCGNPRPPLNHYNFNVQQVLLNISLIQ